MTPENLIALAPRFARVVLPLPIEQAFTYEIPDAMQGRIAVGCRASFQ